MVCLHQILAGNVITCLESPTTTKSSNYAGSSSGVVVTLENSIGLGLTVTEINIKKVQKQDLKQH